MKIVQRHMAHSVEFSIAKLKTSQVMVKNKHLSLLSHSTRCIFKCDELASHNITLISTKFRYKHESVQLCSM